MHVFLNPKKWPQLLLFFIFQGRRLVQTFYAVFLTITSKTLNENQILCKEFVGWGKYHCNHLCQVNGFHWAVSAWSWWLKRSWPVCTKVLPNSFRHLFFLLVISLNYYNYYIVLHICICRSGIASKQLTKGIKGNQK